jgi:iron complex transport system ATP-binding protein
MSGNLAGGGRLGALAAALAAAFPVFFALARDLDLVSLGDRAATDLGVDLRRTRAALFFSGSLVTGAAVASSGLIGFVGLIVPHALRLLLGPDHRLLVPAALFGGAGFLALADGAARSVLTPEDLPVGVLTALAGGPFFVWLLLRPGPRERRSGHGRTLREALAEPPPAVPISARAPPLNAPSRPSARAAGHGNPATRARPAIGRPEEEPRGTLSARAVACSYGVRGLDLELRPGELLALFGPNGAGKSTLLRLFSGEIVPEAGCVDLGGRPLRALSRREIARLFATVPQEPIPALPYTVGEVVLMGRAPRVRRFRLEADPDVRAAEAAIEALGIAALGDRPVAEISGGERQRVAIARALAQNAPYLLLDEPTAFLDVRHQVEVFRLLRALAHEGGRAVLVASHEVNLAAQYADRVALLDRGALCAVGPPEEVLRPETLEAVFGAAVDLARHGRTGRPYFVFGGE